MVEWYHCKHCYYSLGSGCCRCCWLVMLAGDADWCWWWLLNTSCCNFFDVLLWSIIYASAIFKTLLLLQQLQFISMPLLRLWLWLFPLFWTKLPSGLLHFRCCYFALSHRCITIIGVNDSVAVPLLSCSSVSLLLLLLLLLLLHVLLSSYYYSAAAAAAADAAAAAAAATAASDAALVVSLQEMPAAEKRSTFDEWAGWSFTSHWATCLGFAAPAAHLPATTGRWTYSGLILAIICNANPTASQHWLLLAYNIYVTLF